VCIDAAEKVHIVSCSLALTTSDNGFPIWQRREQDLAH
jgi:hypothetical protein